MSKPSSSRSSAGPLLVVVSGPSGAGKDSLLLRLRERGVDAYYASTATTRAPRDGDSLLLHLTSEDFERMLAENGLLEHAHVYGHHYGVPRAPIAEALRRGQDVLIRVDVQGAATIKRLVPGAVLVFLTAPAPVLEARLRARAKDDDTAIARRLQIASREIARSPEFDYVIENIDDQLDAAVDELEAIIARERERRRRDPIDL